MIYMISKMLRKKKNKMWESKTNFDITYLRTFKSNQNWSMLGFLGPHDTATCAMCLNLVSFFFTEQFGHVDSCFVSTIDMAWEDPFIPKNCQEIVLEFSWASIYHIGVHGNGIKVRCELCSSFVSCRVH